MNFSIIVPGPCNANCSFCFWKQEEETNNYLERLNEALREAPIGMDLSITGGEPTISSMFDAILILIEPYKYKFNKIVLTTNGSKLNQKILYIKDIVDHVNISRHHHDSAINSNIFNSKGMIDENNLIDLCDELNAIGIDVNLNAVLTDELNKYEEIVNYIDFAKNIGASSVCFRKQHNDSLEPSEAEKSFSKYKSMVTNECPVCRLTGQLIKGMKVYWQASKIEPSEILDVYEVIFQPSGKLTCDWSGTISVKLENKTYVRNGENIVDIYLKANPRKSYVDRLKLKGFFDAVTPSTFNIMDDLFGELTVNVSRQTSTSVTTPRRTPASRTMTAEQIHSSEIYRGCGYFRGGC